MGARPALYLFLDQLQRNGAVEAAVSAVNALCITWEGVDALHRRRQVSGCPTASGGTKAAAVNFGKGVIFQLAALQRRHWLSTSTFNQTFNSEESVTNQNKGK